MIELLTFPVLFTLFYFIFCSLVFRLYIRLIRQDYDITYKILGLTFLAAFVPVYNVFVAIKKIKQYFDANIKDKVVLKKYSKIEDKLTRPIVLTDDIYTTIDLEELEARSNLGQVDY